MLWTNFWALFHKHIPDKRQVLDTFTNVAPMAQGCIVSQKIIIVLVFAKPFT
jgi:hypothetical protein